MAESEPGTRAPLVGNRLVLVGAVLYLLEWVAIIAASLDAPQGAGGSTRDLVEAYGAQHVQAWGWAAGWFSVVLLGRVLIMVGLRAALEHSGRPHPLMGLAVPAMVTSVALEIATYAVVSGAVWAQAHGGSAASLRGLDATAFQLNLMIFGPAGVAVLCAGAAMWASQLFPRALSALALLTGALLTLAGAVSTAPKLSGLEGALSSAVALFWIWMLWLGVLLWRRAPAGSVVLRARPRPRSDVTA
jgi:hypothetical protein